MEKEKKNKLTIGDITTLVGLTFIGLLTFMGEMYLSIGNYASSIIWAFAVFIIFGFLINLASNFKGKKIDAHLSAIFQLGIILAYMTIAIFTANRPLSGISAWIKSDKYRELANEDVHSLDSLFLKYETFESNALSNTKVSLNTAISGIPIDDDVKTYLDQMLTARKLDVVDKYISQEETFYLGTDGSEYGMQKDSFNIVIHQLEDKAINNTFISLPCMVGDIEIKGKEIIPFLNRMSSDGRLPKFKMQNGLCVVDISHQSIYLDEPQWKLKNEIEKGLNYGIWPILIIIFLHLLVFLPYLAKTGESIFLPSYFSTKRGDDGVELK